ncbi:hypothetical protein scyTo_0018343, partial [Scyliorhinus torazame]|nr:hypothetical protein [Scyliorhinus torazame]
MFVIQNIENSNLLLLVTEAYCDCSIFPPVTLEPKEVKYILYITFKCERMRTQKLRRRPDSCHAFHPEENAEECGGASGISLAGTLLALNLGMAVAVLQ